VLKKYEHNKYHQRRERVNIGMGRMEPTPGKYAIGVDP
jgi:hypothetical protein